MKCGEGGEKDKWGMWERKHLAREIKFEQIKKKKRLIS
jgi:hypothetical protein